MQQWTLWVIAKAATLISLIDALRIALAIFSKNVGDYGYIRGLALETIFLQARFVVGRVRRHVLKPSGDGAREAWSIKESYASNFSMIGVAGAIVAQIAITALSLEYLEATHWTATAAFVISLVAGLLSVYYACILQQQLSGLHGPDEVKRWLTAVRSKRRSAIDSKIEAGRQTHNEYVIPSYNAALLLVLPSILLNWSSIALLVGIGIYYGIVHTENLSSVRGENSSLAILLAYVLFTSMATASYFLPWLQKRLESTPPAQAALARVLRDESPESPPSDARPGPLSSLQPNEAQNGVRVDLLITSGIESPRHPVARQDGAPGREHNVQVPTGSPTQDVPSSQSYRGQWPASNDPQVHFQAKQSLSRTPSYTITATEAFVAALDASILAQKANLQAHELLRSELQQQENLRTFTRRVSL